RLAAQMYGVNSNCHPSCSDAWPTEAIPSNAIAATSTFFLVMTLSFIGFIVPKSCRPAVIDGFMRFAPKPANCCFSLRQVDANEPPQNVLLDFGPIAQSKD